MKYSSFAKFPFEMDAISKNAFFLQKIQHCQLCQVWCASFPSALFISS